MGERAGKDTVTLHTILLCIVYYILLYCIHRIHYSSKGVIQENMIDFDWLVTMIRQCDNI
jgi:hypothetical protein